MPEDYYNAPEGAPASGTARPSDEPSGDEDQMEGQTALLPKSIFGDNPPEVGQTCTFTVQHIYEDEVEVAYNKSGEESQTPEPKPQTSMDTATDSFDQMTQGKA